MTLSRLSKTVGKVYEARLKENEFVLVATRPGVEANTDTDAIPTVELMGDSFLKKLREIENDGDQVSIHTLKSERQGMIEPKMGRRFAQMGSCNPMSDSDVVQKYSDLCTWSAGPRSTTALRGTTSIVERNTSDCGKRKLTAYKDPDVFEAYSHLCARNVRPRSSSDLPKAAGVNNFGGKQNSDSDVFQRYAELCAQNATQRFSDNLSDIVRGNRLTNSQPVYNEASGSVFFKEVLTKELKRAEKEKQRILQTLHKSSILAKAQMRLAKLDQLRQGARTGVKVCVKKE
ncbi:hypothetical protein Tco_1554652 [Tanacetum coccineum]